ncbi:hypothetical protein [Cupriavidus sp. M-11]|uniref:hypothetical protein n=1 Tax=Cupriavidus sp. M-11 TaxID=3233038 RepID=UPI003F8FD241
MLDEDDEALFGIGLVQLIAQAAAMLPCRGHQTDLRGEQARLRAGLGAHVGDDGQWRGWRSLRGGIRLHDGFLVRVSGGGGGCHGGSIGGSRARD